MTVYGLQNVFFYPYKSKKKHFCLNDIVSVLCHVSPKISFFALLVCSKLDCQKSIIARHVIVHRNAIQSLSRRLRQYGNTRDCQRLDRPRVTSFQQDNHIRLVHMRDRFQSSFLTARSIPGLRPISVRTVHNKLRDRHSRPRRPPLSPMLRPRHRAARLTWCRFPLRQQ